MFNKAIQELINHFKKLPGIGEINAQRFVFSVIKKGSDEQKKFGECLLNLDKNINYCPLCQGFSDHDLCEICNNKKRNSQQICVIENVFEIIPMEKTGIYTGVYHVLHGVLSPIDGIKPEDLKIKELLERIKKHSCTEIIFALSTTLEGEATVHYIKNLLPSHIKITHLARGLPTGASLEYADEITLRQALNDRK